MTGLRSSQKIRVFLVDDHPIVRRGLQYLLGLAPGMSVCGEADSGPSALQQILSLRPDIAIVDLRLNSGSGLELIKELRNHLPALKILVFSMQAQSLYAERAFRAGAHGYITKEEGAEKAIEAIRLVMQGKTCLSQTLTESLVARLRESPAPGRQSVEALSDRELEVLEAVGNGLGSREIAENLRLSIKTVESHREHIKTKLGLKRASQLVNYAYTWVRGA